MQRLIFILSLFILAIVGCSSNESHSFLIRPDGGGEDAATEIEVGKTIPQVRVLRPTLIVIRPIPVSVVVGIRL